MARPGPETDRHTHKRARARARARARTHAHTHTQVIIGGTEMLSPARYLSVLQSLHARAPAASPDAPHSSVHDDD